MNYTGKVIATNLPIRLQLERGQYTHLVIGGFKPGRNCIDQLCNLCCILEQLWGLFVGHMYVPAGLRCAIQHGIHRGCRLNFALTPRFVNELPGALKALTLLFADDVKMATRRTQNISLHSSPITAHGWSKKWDLPIHFAKCNYLIIEREVPWVRF